jgi:hypothetical protein
MVSLSTNFPNDLTFYLLVFQKTWLLGLDVIDH